MTGPGVRGPIEPKEIREFTVLCRRSAKDFERAHGSSLEWENLFLMHGVLRELNA